MAQKIDNNDNYSAQTDSDYNSQADADHLHAHAQITADPARHAAAHQVLQQRAQDTQKSVAQSKKGMKAKVRKGLDKAFPKAGDAGQTPFQKAGKEGVPPVRPGAMENSSMD